MARPSYGCVKVDKIKYGNIKCNGSMKTRYEHNCRITHVPKNVDPELTKYNKEYVKLDKGETYYSTYKNEIDTAIATGKMKNVRANAVLGLEIEINYTLPEQLQLNVDSVYEWGEEVTKWLKERFGENNVKHVILHYDEDVTYSKEDTNCEHPEKHPHPHIHAFVVPMNDKGRLCSSDFIAGPFGENSTSELQDQYYNKVGKKFNMQRGVKNSGLDYKRIREHKKNIYSKCQATVQEYELLPGEDLKTYNERVIATANKQFDQHYHNISELKAEFKFERSNLQLELENERTSKQKELQKKEEEYKKEYEKKVEEIKQEYEAKTASISEREHLVEEAARALMELSRGKEDPQKELEKKLLLYGSLEAAMVHYPDKDRIKALQKEIFEISQWQYRRDRKTEKQFDRLK